MQLLVFFSKTAASSRITGVLLAVIRPRNAVARFFFYGYLHHLSPKSPGRQQWAREVAGGVRARVAGSSVAGGR